MSGPPHDNRNVHCLVLSHWALFYYYYYKSICADKFTTGLEERRTNNYRGIQDFTTYGVYGGGLPTVAEAWKSLTFKLEITPSLHMGELPQG